MIRFKAQVVGPWLLAGLALSGPARGDDTAQSYPAHIAAAHAHLRLEEVPAAGRWLGAAPEPRGWEWRWLARQLDASVRRIDVFDGAVTDLALLDGDRIAAAGDDGRVRLLSLSDGSLLQTLEGHEAAVMAVEASPDGGWLATASRDRTVRLWEAGRGWRARTLDGHTEVVGDVAFSPDGRRLASASYARTATGTEGEVRIWDVARRRGVDRLPSDTYAPVVALAFHPTDADLLLAGSWDQTTKLFRLAGRSSTSAELLPATGYRAVHDVAWWPDGSRYASGAEDGTLRVWSADQEPLLRIDAHARAVEALAIAPDGATLASASTDHQVRLWDAATGESRGRLLGHTGAVQALAWRGTEGLVTAGDDGTLRLWDVEAARTPHPLIDGASPWGLVFLPDGRLVVGRSDGALEVRSADGGTIERRIEVLDGWVNDVVLVGDDRLLVSASDGIARVLSIATGEELLRLEGHSRAVAGVAADGDSAVTGGRDGVGRLWDLATGEPLAVLEGRGGVVESVGIRGDRVATSSSEGVAQLWTRDGLPVAEVAHPGRVQRLVLSPEGDVLATAGTDGTVRLWSTADGAPRGVLVGHDHNVNGVAFGPGPDRILTGSRDRTLRLWDLETHAPLLVIGGWDGIVWSIAVDDQRVAVGTLNHQLRLLAP